MHTGDLASRWVGRRFDYLTVMEVLPNRKVKCLCDCGNETTVYRNNLGRGNTTSCGCVWYSEVANKGSHNKSKSRTYRIWANMKSRCTNPNFDSYKYYGARGISVCSRWQLFENFLEDMGEPEESLTLDRIDNDGDYCPSNCRWITMKEQCANRRSK